MFLWIRSVPHNKQALLQTTFKQMDIIFVLVLQTSLVFMNSVLSLNDEHIAWDFCYFLSIQVLLKIGVRKNERGKKKPLLSISLKSCWPVSCLCFCYPTHSFHLLLSAVDMDINKARRLLLEFFGIQANDRILMENLFPALLEHRFKRKVINTSLLAMTFYTSVTRNTSI